MSERDDYEALFLAHLPFVRKVVARVLAQSGLRGADAEDAAAWVEARLWEDDYAILRKWRGESKLTTYLTVVIANLWREFRVKEWGRWRPPVAALRLGPLAVRLVTLVHRDGLTLAQAAEHLRTRGETRLSDRELAELLARVPMRDRPRVVDDREVPIETVADERGADERVLDVETAAARRSLHDKLVDAIARLDPLARVVIQMHFLEGHSLADVARALGTEQRPLYRLKDRSLATLKGRLLDAGVTHEQVHDLIGGALDGDGGAPPDEGDPHHPDGDAGAQPGGKTDDPRPSNGSCDSNPTDEESGSSDSEQSGRSDP